MNRHIRRVYNARPALLLILVVSAGCAVRRPYQAPAPEAPAAWTEAVPAPSAETPDASGEALAAWWETFGDPQLTSLVRRAVAGNLDVRTSLSRLREARASVRSSRSALTPTVDASGSARLSGTAGGNGPGNTSQSYSLGLDASWEVDVFG
jgi:multidrug efflux system outer membrane protein